MTIFTKKIPPVAVPISFNDIINTLATYIRTRNPLESFETNLAMKSEVKFAVCFGSGSRALFHLLKVISQESDRDEIIIPSFTCPSVYFTIKEAGLKPVITDIDSNTLNISPKGMLQKITSQTLAVIVPDMFGKTNSFAPIKPTLTARNIFLIADMAQSIAAAGGMRVAHTEKPDFFIYSFGRAKMISTLEGGSVLTDHEYYHINLLKHSSRTNSRFTIKDLFMIIKMMTFALAIHPLIYSITSKYLKSSFSQDPFRLSLLKSHVSNDDIITSFQSCLGIRMLSKLERMNTHRRKIAMVYLNAIKKIDSITLPSPENNFFLRFPIIIHNHKTYEKAITLLLNNNFTPSLGIYPVLSTIESTPGYFDSRYPEGSEIANCLFSLPTHLYVSEFEALKVANKLNTLFISESYSKNDD